MFHSFNPTVLSYYRIPGTAVCPVSNPEVKPEEFLSFAQEEFRLTRRSSRNYVNAVLQARVALHYQVETLSNALGWRKMNSTESLLGRVNFLSRCGVLSKGVARRIQANPILVLQPFYLPSEEQALECLDLAELVFGATDSTARFFPNSVDAVLEVDVGDVPGCPDLPDIVRIELPVGDGHLRALHQGRSLVDVAVPDDGYFSWVAAVLARNSER